MLPGQADEQQAIIAVTLSEDLFGRWISFIDASNRTVDTYRTNVRLFMEYLRRNNINNPQRQDIINYREELKEKGRSPATIQGYLTSIKLFFQWTSQEGLYPNVAEHIKGVKISPGFKKDYLTSRQTRSLLATCNRDAELGRRDFALLSLMATTGLRTIEVARANIGDMRNHGEYTVLYVQGKGRDDRTEYVKLEPPVEDAIRGHLKDREDTGAAMPLIVSLSHRNLGMRLTTRSIRRIVKVHLVDAGLSSNRLTAHSLRHTAATLMLKNGAKLTEVQQVLRHRNLNTTMVYNHDLERAANQGESLAARAIFEYGED